MEKIDAFLQKHSKFISYSNLIAMLLALGWLGYQHFNPKEEHMPLLWEWAAYDHITVESLELGLVCKTHKTHGTCVDNWIKYRAKKNWVAYVPDLSWDVFTDEWRNGIPSGWTKEPNRYVLEALNAEAEARIKELAEQNHTVDALDVSKINEKLGEDKKFVEGKAVSALDNVTGTTVTTIPNSPSH